MVGGAVGEAIAEPLKEDDQAKDAVQAVAEPMNTTTAAKRKTAEVFVGEIRGGKRGKVLAAADLIIATASAANSSNQAVVPAD